MKYLVILFCAVLLSFSVLAETQTPPAIAKKPSSRDLIIHVMNRMAFGARPADVTMLEKSGPGALKNWMKEQMKAEHGADPALEAKLKNYPSLDMEAKDLYQHYIKGGATDKDDPTSKNPGELIKEIQSAKIIRAVEAKRQLEEVLLDFWFNHFNVDVNKNEIKYMIADYQDKTLRPRLFGKFSELLLATAKHPAMLIYLDNRQSRKNNINENYAREVMELHTLGVDGGYTQKDVENLARILTGWSVTDLKESPQFLFKEKQHDDKATEFLGKPLTSTGVGQGEEALRRLASDSHTAMFIATKLVRAFVSDDPPKALVDRIASVFTKTDGDLKKVYEVLFFSDDFMSLKYAGSKIKKPLWIVASAVRSCGGEIVKTNRLTRDLAEMGEDIYKAGAPTGFVDDPSRWINPGSMIIRLQFALDLASQKIDGLYCSWDPISHAKNLDSWISELGQHHLNLNVKSQTMQVIRHELGQEPIEFSNKEVRPSIYLKSLGLLLASPEFQKR